MRSKTRAVAFPIIGAAVLSATLLTGQLLLATEEGKLEADEQTLESLQSEIRTAQAQTDAAAVDAASVLSGAQADRVKADTELIEDLADRALTWFDHESYVEARESTMRAYGLTPDSTFMTSFLPPAPVNLDSKGAEYPYIDAAGLNSRATSTHVRLLSVDGVDYSYMALIDVAASSSDGLGSASNVATVFLTIDSDGAITDLSGYAATSTPATSKR